MTNSTESINEITQYLRQMRLPIMADRLIDLYSDPLSNKRSTLDILFAISAPAFLKPPYPIDRFF